MRLPAKGDFGHGWKANTGAVLAVVGGLAIPGLSGWAYNMAFDKWLADPVSEFAGDYTPHVKTLSRLGVKAAVGLGSAYAVAKMTHKPHLGRLMVLGTVIALIIDGISAVAGVAIGSQNPFGKAIIMRGTPKPTIKGAVLNTFGLGEAAIAYSAFRDGNLAKSGVRILQHPSGSMGLYAPGKGIIMEGKPSAVLGRYHTIMSARSRGLGEMISIESGMRGQPWVGEADI
jgi:hypothetical protein